MPAATATFGITRHTGTLVHGVEISNKIEKKVLKNLKGVDTLVHPYNPTNSGSIKGAGAPVIAAPGAGDSGITGFAGVTIIDEVKITESNEDFVMFEVPFSNYPNATVVVDVA